MQKFFNNKHLTIIFRAILIAVAIIGILSNGRVSSTSQLWYFTIQTNIFVIIIQSILLVCGILKLFGWQEKISSSKIFYFFKSASVLYISITGIIFCFVLIPVAVISRASIISNIFYRDILLHIFVPILTLVDYFALGEKQPLEKINALYFLIYPVVYSALILIKPYLNNTIFYGNSKYPYFFLDPTFNNQGFVAVAFYLILCLILFALLGLLLIFINNKFLNKTIKKELF